MIAVAVTRFFVMRGQGWTRQLYLFSMRALLRRNLLAHILARPGAHALPGSVGEALNRFRDDITNVEQMLVLILGVAGLLLFSVIAFFTLLSINIQITLLVEEGTSSVKSTTSDENSPITKYNSNGICDNHW